MRFGILLIEGKEFFRLNLSRFVSYFVFTALGIALGIWYGSQLSSEAAYFLHSQNHLVEVIYHTSSFMRYFFGLIFEIAIIIGIILALSMHYYLSFLTYVIFVYKGYLLAFGTIVLLLLARLSCLPLILLCVIPFSLANIFCLSCLCVQSASVSSYAYSRKCSVKISEILNPCLLLLLAMLALCILETTLVFVIVK